MNQENAYIEASLGDRIAIVQEATALYLDEDTSYTVANLATQLEVEPADIYAYYPNKYAILDGYYTLLMDRYRNMIKEIDNFDQYNLAEKISNFIYASFDMMTENRVFVEETFEQRVLNATGEHPFQSEIKKLFKEFFAKDSSIAGSSQLLMQDIFYEFLARQYFQLVTFWLKDESPDHEKTMAYADKLTSFLQEVMYTTVLDKGLELLKFMAQHDRRISRIPLIGSLTRKILS